MKVQNLFNSWKKIPVSSEPKWKEQVLRWWVMKNVPLPLFGLVMPESQQKCPKNWWMKTFSWLDSVILLFRKEKRGSECNWVRGTVRSRFKNVLTGSLKSAKIWKLFDDSQNRWIYSIKCDFFSGRRNFKFKYMLDKTSTKLDQELNCKIKKIYLDLISLGCSMIQPTCE